ncbi:AAA family ATPase [Acididesulfobacillus acetoxydans]|uniref:AAA family ATPase n=1 Tax=Acididesulfobacillus acetoxydans TaxID=1561005 RepID=UPI001F0EA7E0|nr:AAA family ATPase [Acididesulfobacillus acetoxydans]
MKKRIAIGVSDFREMLTGAYYYVDKTLFIKDILEDGSKVILLPRPRRFGKTLNMSMLRYFFEKSAPDHSGLFENLAICRHADCMAKQGQYPVIYLTFKDLKHNTWKVTYDSFVQLIYTEYNRHLYLLDSSVMSDMDKKYFRRVSMEEGSEADYAGSIKKLSEFLSKHYGKKTIILIDEYDVPIQQAYLKQYYDPLVSFLRNLMTAALKDNNYLEKAVLTGVMRVARESLFSGLNNLSVWTLLDEPYSRYFGFLESEVEELLNYYGIESQIEEVRSWYNGYIFGDTVVYNPWSVLKYAQNWQGGLQPYWVNTSDNELVKRLISKGGYELKSELEELLQGGALVKTINQNISMGEVEQSEENVWSFLLFSGYLKALTRDLIRGDFVCRLAIPNYEVEVLYQKIILSWFVNQSGRNKLQSLLNSLMSGEVKTFTALFKEYVMASLSYFDTGGQEPEQFYHAFVLGLLVGLRPEHEVKSNRESGYGRYDVMIIPRDLKQAGIIIEFKKVEADEGEDLEKAAERALQQIDAKEYGQELIERGIRKIRKLGIAFRGKEVLVRAKDWESQTSLT